MSGDVQRGDGWYIIPSESQLQLYFFMGWFGPFKALVPSGRWKRFQVVWDKAWYLQWQNVNGQYRLHGPFNMDELNSNAFFQLRYAWLQQRGYGPEESIARVVLEILRDRAHRS